MTESFFDSIRQSLFGGRLTQGVVDTSNAIIGYYQQRYSCQKCLAYILATACHESYNARANPNWLPVREGFASSNAGAIRAVTALYNAGRISTNYALPQANKKSYYGRGYVQVTWPSNYLNIGRNLGIDLYGNPDLALQRDVAVRILVEGMVNGWFTGRRVANYFLGSMEDPYSARRVVNGLDKFDLIAGYYYKFKAALPAGTLVNS